MENDGYIAPRIVHDYTQCLQGGDEANYRGWWKLVGTVVMAGLLHGLVVLLFNLNFASCFC